MFQQEHTSPFYGGWRNSLSMTNGGTLTSRGGGGSLSMTKGDPYFLGGGVYFKYD